MAGAESLCTIRPTECGIRTYVGSFQSPCEQVCAVGKWWKADSSISQSSLGVAGTGSDGPPPLLHAQVKRCDEMARRLRFFQEQVDKAGLKVLPVGEFRDKVELDALEGRLEELERDLINMNENSERLDRTYNELNELQVRSCLCAGPCAGAWLRHPPFHPCGGTNDLKGIMPHSCTLAATPESACNDVGSNVLRAGGAGEGRQLLRQRQGVCAQRLQPGAVGCH